MFEGWVNLAEGTTHFVMAVVADHDGKPVWTVIVSPTVDKDKANDPEPLPIKIESYHGSYGFTPYQELVRDLREAGVDLDQFDGPPLEEMLEGLRKKFEGIEDPEVDEESPGPEALSVDQPEAGSDEGNASSFGPMNPVH